MTRRIATILALLALVASACSGGDDSGATTTVADTTTTTLAPDAPIGSETADQIRDEVATLIEVTEDLRGLEFITDPEVAVLNTEDMAARVEELIGEDLDLDEVAVADSLYTLLGMMDENQDLAEIYLDVLSEQVAGFYQSSTGELVVRASSDGLSVFDRSVVVHELVHALTDQHFRFGRTLEELVEADRFEEAAALQALGEGDATYIQLLYIEGLPAGDQLSLALEALDVDTSAMDAAPEFVEADLSFPYLDGYDFVLDLVSTGGIGAIDAAYLDLPVTTEQILHPERYTAGDVGERVDLPPTPVPGYEVFEEGIFGEWGLRLVLLDSLPSGDVTQAGTGWRGDAYRILSSGDDVALVISYLGETEEDAIELTQALIDHVRRAMDVGDGVGDGGGLLFTGADGYVFIDRAGDALTFIAATDAAAGEALRSAAR